MPDGLYANNTKMEEILLNGNELSSLPDGFFVGLTNLWKVRLENNPGSPFALTISLEKVGDGGFKAVMPSGAPFEIVLPISAENGDISDGVTTLTIPTGGVESDSVTVTRTLDTTRSVTVNIGTLPGLPEYGIYVTVPVWPPESFFVLSHQGYTLVKSEELPLELESEIPTFISSRTRQVKDGIVTAARAAGVELEQNLTAEHLASITSLVLTNTGITALKPGDFDGLTGLIEISLDQNQLSALPPGIFDELTNLIELRLPKNQLSSLPAQVFDELTALKTLTLYDNQFSALPDDIFDELTALEVLWLSENQFSALPDDIFDGLTALKTLNLSDNQLSALPAGIFDGVTTLEELALSGNQFSALSDDTFDGLTALKTLILYDNQFSALPDDIFDELTALEILWLSKNQFSALPDDIFDGLTALKTLALSKNQFSALPDDIFDELTALETLWLTDTQLSTLPAEVFDGLSALQNLYLYRNQLSALPAGIFDGLTSLIELHLAANAVNPLPMTISLEKVGEGEFKAVAPTGAPFDIVVPLTATNGSIDGGTTTITISKGSMDSDTLTVTRTAGTTTAVTLDIGTLPGLPSKHAGYQLVRSDQLPLAAFSPSLEDWMPDANLRTVVREALSLEVGGVLTQALMENLTELRAPQSNIGSLTGLEYATGLTTLVVWQNQISDISPVAGLTSLTDFRIGRNQISDISAIEKLTALTHLALQNNQITDVSSLAGLDELEWLRIGDNDGLTDMSPVAWLPNLTDVEVDIPPAAKIENVPEEAQTGAFDVIITFSETVTGDPSSGFLTLSGDATATVTVLQHTNTVNYPNSFIATITLTGSGELMFNVTADVVTDSDGLPNTASEMHTVEVEPDANTVNIPNPETWMPDANLRTAVREALSLEVGGVLTQALMENLTELRAPQSNIGSLTGLEYATGLTTLVVWQNQISDISPVAELTSLTDFRIGRNQISDISAIEKLTALTHLALQNNQITDVSSLAELDELEWLRLKNNGILDTSPLYDIVTENETDVDITISEYPPWDVNEDGHVDALDSALVTIAIGQSGGDIVNPRTDVNGDGTVDNTDLMLVTEHFSSQEALAPSGSDIARLLDPGVLETLDRDVLEAQLSILRAESDGSLKYLRAIGLLESMLAALRPNETLLLANYPNPFNPETWIPYQLANASDVRITIYDTRGTVIRRLALGHQREGYYTSRSRAAYWDGRNSVGERVASGIYFYQLQADNMSLLRKMVILK